MPPNDDVQPPSRFWLRNSELARQYPADFGAGEVANLVGSLIWHATAKYPAVSISFRALSNLTGRGVGEVARACRELEDAGVLLNDREAKRFGITQYGVDIVEANHAAATATTETESDA